MVSLYPRGRCHNPQFFYGFRSRILSMCALDFECLNLMCLSYFSLGHNNRSASRTAECLPRIPCLLSSSVNLFYFQSAVDWMLPPPPATVVVVVGYTLACALGNGKSIPPTSITEMGLPTAAAAGSAKAFNAPTPFTKYPLSTASVWFAVMTDKVMEEPPPPPATAAP